MLAHLTRAPAAMIAALLALLALPACAREIDMASAYDAQRAATIVPYSGVRDASRIYPDYGAIGASILTASPDGTKAPALDGAASGPRPQARKGGAKGGQAP
jgi:hypothetical protein